MAMMIATTHATMNARMTEGLSMRKNFASSASLNHNHFTPSLRIRPRTSRPERRLPSRMSEFISDFRSATATATCRPMSSASIPFLLTKSTHHYGSSVPMLS
jgi:hypothetical protein